MTKQMIDNLIGNIGYDYYFDDKLNTKPQGMNCSDEICPGSHERTQKIRALINKKIRLDENFTEKWAETIHELHDLMRDEHMGITGCTENQANQFLDATVDFTHVKQHIIKGEVYLSADPTIGYKY